MTSYTDPRLRMSYYDLLPFEIRAALANYPDNITNTEVVYAWWKMHGLAWTLDRIEQNRRTRQ